MDIMQTTRRQFVAGAAAATTALSQTRPAANGVQSHRRIHLAVSTYSYWHFKPEKYPIEKIIEDAARMGFDGVEILHRGMQDETVPYMNRLKSLAFRNGLALPMLSIHQNFVSPDAAEREKHIEHTKHCIDLAAQMGIPCVRLNSGRWGTDQVVRRPDEGER